MGSWLQSSTQCAAARSFRALGKPHVNGVAKLFAPTRIQACGRVNNLRVHHYLGRFGTLRRPGASGVHHWFDAYVLQYAPAKPVLSWCVAATSMMRGGAAAASH